MGWRQPGLQKRIDHEASGIAHQHQLLGELMREVSRELESGSRERCQSVLSRLRGALRAHFLLEEDVVFPAFLGLHPELGEEMGVLSRGHHELWGELEQLELSIDGGDAREATRIFEGFRAGMKAHEAAEEALLSSPKPQP